MPRIDLNCPTTGMEPPEPTSAGAFAPFGFERGARLAHRFTVESEMDGRTAAVLAELHLGIGRQPIRDILAEGGADLLRVLPGDEAERHLGFGGGRQHRFEPGTGIPASKTVDLAGRPRPDLFEDRPVNFAGRGRQPGTAQEGHGVKAEIVPVGPQFR